MQYQLDLEIEQPRDAVVALFLNRDNLEAWQPDLVSYEPLPGPRHPRVGARTREVHMIGNRRVEMIQTVTIHDPPEVFAATYEAEGVWNLVTNHFSEVDESTTHWLLAADFRASGFGMRLMTTFAPFLFRRQTRGFMLDFKIFAESRGA